MRLPPAECEHGGVRWTVRRAWPEGDGHIVLEATSPDGRVRAGRFGADGIVLLEEGHDPRLPALTAAAAEGTVVSHRPGKRAVVRSADGGRFVKIVRPGRTAGILAGIERAAAVARWFRMPEVLDHDETTVTFVALAGRSLHDCAAFSAAEWDRAWAETAAAWARAVSGPERGAVRWGAVHDSAAEAEVLRTWCERAAPLMGAERTGYAAAVEEAAADLCAPAVRARVRRPSHRDLHDKQLLWDAAAGPGLLDADTACLADPALDLGNLRAHALWRARQGVWTAERAATVLTRLREAGARAGVPSAATHLYERAALLRLGCVYAFRPAWHEEAARLRQALVAAR